MTGALLAVAFCWLGLVNVAMLVAFVAVTCRCEQGGAGRVDAQDVGAPVATTPGPPEPPEKGSPLGGCDPAPRPDAPVPRLRASDAERDVTAQTLSRAVADGRLSIDEGRQRLEAACAALYREELAHLVADLPADLPPTERGSVVGLTARDVRDVQAVAVLSVVVAVLVQGFTGLWEVWPVAVAALVPLACRRRVAGVEDRTAVARWAGRGRVESATEVVENRRP